MDAGGRPPEKDVEDWVSEFIGLHERSAAPAPAECVRAVPAALRPRVLAQCRAYLEALPHLAGVEPRPEEVPERLGTYRIERRIGAGGMGTVYAARADDGTLVAIKVLHPHLARVPGVLERFVREREMQDVLDHPLIVAVIEHATQGAWHYLVMELVGGGNLAEVLERDGRPGLAPARAAAAVRDAAEALEHAHRRGVVHRDVKPQNILMAEDGRAHVGDFGLARLVDSVPLTRTGQVIGTYAYMSPEQALARRVKIDHRTDVYSLGVVLYELLTGRAPFKGGSQQELFYAINFRDPAPPRASDLSIPRDLECICLQAMEKRPDDRYATAAELQADLERFLRHEAPTARTRKLWWVAWRRLQRRPLRPVSAAGVLGMLLLAAWAYAIGRAEGAAPPARLALAPTAAVGSARAWIHRLDAVTHARVEREELHLAAGEELEVPAGLVRITFEEDEPAGGAFAELTRTLAPGERVELDPHLVTTSLAVDGMVLVPAGTYRVGRPDPFPHYAREVRIGAFWIDRSEVTNAEYREFIDAVPSAKLPLNWPNGVLPTDWEDLPVIAIRFVDAQEYAEWRGKRLPTWIEWEIGALGPESKTYPWGDDASTLSGDAVVGRAGLGGTDDTKWLGYEVLVQPARVLYGRDRSVFGLLHAFGNVREWTECHLIRAPDRPEEMVAWQRLTKGFDWHDPALTILMLDAVQETPGGSATHVGFRCAKSADPSALFDPQEPPREEKQR